VAVEFQRFFGKEPGIALLAGLLSIKLLETNSVRDARTVILLSFFMQMGLFLYQQNMGVAALALAGSVATVAALLALEGRAEAPRARSLAAARLVIQGLPLMAVLFVLFPRIQGPLWGLPADAYTHRTGLSDSMAPGDVARVSESAAIAFRARFEGDPPPPAERYWRGPVLSDYDGRTWRQGRRSVAEAPAYRSQGTAYTYTLTLEPHNHRWLLALDFPAAAPGLRYSSDFQLLAQAPLHARLRVDLVSHPGTLVGLDESDAVLQQALYLPPGSNPRTRALGARLRTEARASSDIPALAIAHFRANKLAYTLDPLPFGRDDVDSFLFDTRQGFCEHFAAAFVVTLRAAGVPARVVTGYQGGEINAVDGSFVVRQSDAHAWTEVWLAGKGWQRIDPTAASAPRRIDSGLAGALPGMDRLPLLVRSDLPWLRTLRDNLEAIDNRWNQWVLGYNPARQQALLSALGLARTDWTTLIALMAAAGAVVAALLAAWALRSRSPADAIDHDWTRFCQRLAAIGLPRETWEGPLDYARRVGSRRPDLSPAVTAIATDYAGLRYGPAGNDTVASRRFHQSIKNFRPR
jgi:transglutaminase-like putative cysteine protease